MGQGQASSFNLINGTTGYRYYAISGSMQQPMGIVAVNGSGPVLLEKCFKNVGRKQNEINVLDQIQNPTHNI